MIPDRYRTLSSEGHAQVREKASRFIAYALHVADEEDIKERLQAIAKEHHTSRHVCYAWVLDEDGERHRSNDAGEPSGTAGRPILQRIRSLELTYCLVVVVRYFGGTLLGKAGLVRAYGEAAGLALENATTEERLILEAMKITCSYAQVEALRKEVLAMDGVVRDSAFGEACELVVAIPRSRTEEVAAEWMIQGITVQRKSQRK